MPRTYGKVKQMRLSFAPVASSSQDVSQSPKDEKDRRANLRYEHPSLPMIRYDTPSKVDRLTRRKKSSTPHTQSSEERSPSRPEQMPQKSKKGQAVRRSASRPIITLDQDGDSDLEIRHSPRKNMRIRSSKRKRSESETSDSPSRDQPNQNASEQSDEEIITRPRRKLRRGVATGPTIILDDDSQESEGPVVSSPAKRRKRNMVSEDPQTPRRTMDQDQLDLKEDLEDLQDSVIKNTRTRGRLANSARAQRQRHLETLRRRRGGEKQLDNIESEQEPEGSEPNGTESESESENEAESESETPIRKPRFRQDNSDVESSVASNEDLDRYEEDFVEEDDNDELGVPSLPEDMPFEFTRHAYKQLKEYFQDAVEWMVQNKLNPAFPRSSPLYEVAFTKLEDEVKGRTGSQLLSSVWNVNFRRALLARPHAEITGYPITDNHPCDACNRSGHPASFGVKLYGKAYSLETLEPLSDEESDEENEDDGQERDREGYVLPDEDTRFYLGRHCKNKATLAHTLTHWRFHLNEWVVDYLDRMSYLTDEGVLERSHWSQKRTAKYAVEAMGMMIESGEVKKLWRDFHITLRSARENDC